MTVPEPSSVPVVPAMPIAGFWRRLLALLVDFVILGLVGFVLGLLFGDAFAAMGGWARAVGFAIALPYFGLMNSRLGGGQTVGKRVVKVRAVGVDGAGLAVGQSLLRAAVFCLPIFLNNAAISMDLLQSWLGYVLSLAIFGMGLSTIYLYIFNRKTRQCLHDLVVGSMVVKADDAGALPLAAAPWRGHFAVVSLIFLAAAVAPYFGSKLAGTDTFAGLISLQQALAAEPGVMSANVSSGSTSFRSTDAGPRTQTSLAASIRLADKDADYDSMANRVASIVLSRFPDAASKDVISVIVVHGYDIGIASSWYTKAFSFSPAEWRERIKPAPAVAAPVQTAAR